MAPLNGLLLEISRTAALVYFNIFVLRQIILKHI